MNKYHNTLLLLYGLTMQPTKHTCNDIHSSICCIISYQFNPGEGQVIIKLKTDISSIIELWFPCFTDNEVEELQHTLNKRTYWKVYYLCNAKKITKMEPQKTRCIIQ